MRREQVFRSVGSGKSVSIVNSPEVQSQQTVPTDTSMT